LKINLNPWYNLKRRRFILKKKRTRRRVVWSLFIVFFFHMKKTALEPYLQVHLLLDFSIKSNTTCTKRIPYSSSTTPCERCRMNDNTASPGTAWRGQCRQPFSCRFDNSGRLLWTNGWDPSQHNQGLKFFPGIDKIALFHRL